MAEPLNAKLFILIYFIHIMNLLPYIINFIFNFYSKYCKCYKSYYSIQKSIFSYCLYKS